MQINLRFLSGGSAWENRFLPNVLPGPCVEAWIYTDSVPQIDLRFFGTNKKNGENPVWPLVTDRPLANAVKKLKFCYTIDGDFCKSLVTDRLRPTEESSVKIVNQKFSG